MTAVATQMHTLASQARARASVVRDGMQKKEKAELLVRIADWKKREKEKAKRAVVQIRSAIKKLAEQGKGHLIVQVEVKGPYLVSELIDSCKVLDPWGYGGLLQFEIPDSPNRLSLYKTRNLRDGARMIAGWALREGFSVQYRDWSTRIGLDNVRYYDFLVIDSVATTVFGGGGDRGGWPVTEGFLISW